MPLASPNMSRPRLVWGLFAVSMLTFILPQGYTNWARALTQFLVPFQYTVFGATAKVSETVANLDQPTVDYTEFLATRDENEKLAQHVLLLRSQVQQLVRERAELLKVRSHQGLGRFRLVPARIVAMDVMAWRDRAIIDQGQAKHVSREDWVTTRRFLDAGEQQGVPKRDGLAVLAGEYLVGRIEKVRTYTSRVRLFTDTATSGGEVRVKIARRQGDLLVFPLAERYPDQDRFPLVGRGPGRMQVDSVLRAMWDDELIRDGDLVVSSSDLPNLPGSLVIGRVLGMERDDEHPLLCKLRVGWPFDWSTIRQVYVVAQANER